MIDTTATTPESVSKYETHARHCHTPPANSLALQLREKGWSIRDAADYLGVSRQRLYSVFANPSPARLWQCAVSGIPVCTAAIAQSLRDQRRQRIRQRPAAQSHLPSINVGDGVCALTYVGSIADEGDEGWIVGLRGSSKQLELQIRLSGGEDWFPLSDFHQMFALNGKSRLGHGA